MSIKDSRREGVKFILLWVAVAALIGIMGQVARSQELNFDLSTADSIWIEEYNDSLFQLVARVKLETGEEFQVKARPNDSLTTRQYLINIGTQANSRVLDAYRILFERRRINKLTNSIGAALQGFSGLNYNQEQERLYMAELAPCNTAGLCEWFYTFVQNNKPNRIVRIRANGNVREVTALGQTVNGGIQGQVKMTAGAGLFSIKVNAGPVDLIDKDLEFGLSTQTTAAGNNFWRTADLVFKLVRRKALTDAGANFAD